VACSSPGSTIGSTGYYYSGSNSGQLCSSAHRYHSVFLCSRPIANYYVKGVGTAVGDDGDAWPTAASSTCASVASSSVTRLWLGSAAWASHPHEASSGSST
jgi:hypothetical protein